MSSMTEPCLSSHTGLWSVRRGIMKHFRFLVVLLNLES